MEMQNARTKFLLLVHFVFVVFALQGSWLPSSYLFYNLLICLLLIWGIVDRAGDEPFFMLFFMQLMCVIFDIFALVYYSPSFIYAYLSITCTICNMIFRFYSAFVLASVHAERLGRPDSEKWSLLGVGFAEEAIARHVNTGTAQPGPPGGAGRSEYLDVDSPRQSSAQINPPPFPSQTGYPQ